MVPINPNISYELLHTAIQQSPTSIVVTDMKGTIQFVNAHFCKISGYTFEEVMGNNPRVLKSDFHTTEYYTEMWKALSSGNTWSGLFKNRKKNGDLYWEHAHINPVKDASGQITHYIAIKRDVTDEIEGKIKSERRERLLNDIQILSKTGGWELDVPSGNLYWTDELYELHGVTPDYQGDLLELVKTCIHPDDRDLIVQSHRKCLTEGIDYDHVVKFVDQNNIRKWVRTKSRAIKDSKGNVIKIIGSVRDITDEVQNLHKFQKSEKRYKDLFNKSSDASLLFKNGRIFDCNQAAVDLLGFDSIEELTSLHPLDMAPEYQPDGSITADLYNDNVTNATLNRSHRFELYHKKKDGMLIPLEVTTTLLQDVDGEDLVYIIWRDISGRLKAQSELKESLKEKETLLSEVHHRVKNNLAVISALMQLQLYSQDDPFAEEILNKSINRIKSIALIHEQLYKSERFSSISLKENIERQTESVMEMYSDKLAAKVNLQLDLQDISIDINKAMPVGLLLNEILNNIFKHAFKGREHGTISVKLEDIGDQIHVIVADDGVGFDPVEFEGSTSSLGNTLIKTFLEQLHATYTLNSTNGTTFDILFNKF
jgi:PAS domain S-box-containing protein